MTTVTVSKSIKSIMASATIREIIFSPAEFFKKTTTVSGLVVLLDASLGRMDISNDGAKLIVEVGQNTNIEGMEVGAEVLVTGKVKKQQRRTYLEAEKVDIHTLSNARVESPIEINDQSGCN